MSLTINSQRLLDDLTALSHIGATGDGGVHRPALSPADMEARRWFEGRVTAAGLIFQQDGAGNLSAILPAADPAAKTLLTGSHLDTVPHGGRYDGALGTLAALEALRTIREAELSLPVTLEAIAFTDEEGAHLHIMGSRAVVGQIAPDEINHPHNDPAAFREGLTRAGLTAEGIFSARRDPATLAGYVELHIEQGRRLEEAGIDIGVVTAIVGIRSYWLTFRGEAAHAGTKPLADRADALWGAADFIGRARERVLADFAPGTVNCGIVQAAPGAFNIVPGEVRLALEFRHGDEGTLDAMQDALLGLAANAAAAHGLTISADPSGGVIAAAMDERVMAAIEDAAAGLDLSHRRLLSFAGHDAQAMRTITPAGMLFVPSVNGVSHNPQEATHDVDVINGANVLLRTVLALAHTP